MPFNQSSTSLEVLPLRPRDLVGHPVAVAGTRHDLGDQSPKLQRRSFTRLTNVRDGVHYQIVELVVSNLLLATCLCSTLWSAASQSLRAGLFNSCRHLPQMIKTVLDVVASILGLLLLLPLFGLVAIMIRVDSPGPVFYLQQRIGRNRRQSTRRQHDCLTTANLRNQERRQHNIHGKPFRIIKFRTMVANAEKKCGPVWATANDPRVTRVGRILRKFRLDELPQLLNVVKGEMSLIGPRPERPMFVAELSGKVEGYLTRLQVKPGITGLAQVENGYDNSIDSVRAKVKYDVHYISNWSLGLDSRIVLKTAAVVLTGRGAQ